jgi:hypothetical protein
MGWSGAQPLLVIGLSGHLYGRAHVVCLPSEPLAPFAFQNPYMGGLYAELSRFHVIEVTATRERSRRSPFLFHQPTYSYLNASAGRMREADHEG